MASTTWDLRRLQQHLHKHEPHSIYLLFGEDTYLTDESLKLIKEKTLSQGQEDFNFDSFYATETDASRVKDAVETFPVMSAKRLVLYKQADKLKDKQWTELEPLFDNPIDSCTLVIVAEKIDKRKKHFKKLIKNATIVELKTPYDNQVPTWIDYIATQEDIKLTRGANALLHQLVGAQLIELKKAIIKLKTSTDKKRLEEEDVLKVISRTKIDNIFELTDAIGKRDKITALTSLAHLLDQGENEIAILSLITRHIRILSALKQALSEGIRGASQLSSRAGVPSFFLKQYQSQCGLWNTKQISQSLQSLHETDKALKSSPVSSHIWLENFILHSCS